MRCLGGLLPIAAFGFPTRVFGDAVSQATLRETMIEVWRDRIRSIISKNVVPIIDTEATYNIRIDMDEFVQMMEELGVAQVCFAPHGKLGSQYSLRLHHQYPAHIVPTTMDGSSPYWYQHTDRFIADTRRDLATGDFFLMGEFEIRHYPSDAQLRFQKWHRDVTVPIESRAVHELFQLSSETGVAFQMHLEIEDQLLPPLESMLARYPNAKVIWCHLGQIRYPDRSTVYGPAYVRSLIERFRNLHFDLGLTPPNHEYAANGVRDQTIFASKFLNRYGAVLAPDWKSVIEDHPERFLAASDTDPGHYRDLVPKIERMRSIVFDQLSPTTRNLVAYQNAWRLLTGESWRS